MPHNTSSSSLFGRLSARSSFISSKDIKVTVLLLNDSDSISNEFKRSLPAQSILDYICEVKNIKDKDYFGLRYQDHNRHRYWVDLSRPISHITKNTKGDTVFLRLRFRFYPAQPTLLSDLYTRYQLFVQLQRDLFHGRLYCPQAKAVELAALILQAQLGDYNEAEHSGNYVSQYTLLLRQTPRNEEKISELHKSYRGMSTGEAECEFLKRASAVDTYGFDPYTVKDYKDGGDVFLGVNHRGILIFHNNQKTHSILWEQLSKADYIGKEIRVLLSDQYVPPSLNGDMAETAMEKDKKSRLVLKYNCPNGTFAKHLWSHILSQKAFFNEECAQMIKPIFSKPRIPLISRGSTFRYPSQKVLREIEVSHNGGLNTSSDTDHDFSFNETTISFERYPLVKHEPRQEQPWLNKSLQANVISSPLTKTVDNNNDKSVVSMEDDKARVRSESTRSPIIFDESPMVYKQFPSTSSANEVMNKSIDSGRNDSASFVVHLVKYEKVDQSAAVTNEELHQDMSKEAISKMVTSTPILDRSEKKMNGNSVVYQNGTSHKKEIHNVSAVPVSSNKTSLTSVFFVSFLITLLLLALLITIFERNEGSDWLEGVPWLSSFRHHYYEPARYYTLQQYNRFV
ncbi:unnamed protein product [Auanema sp. JU1783]|nr:unnamed protein product [Auanema sp. JU1783]